MVIKHKKIHIPAREIWSDEKEEFIFSYPETDIEIEHSLVSISIWESKYHKPFLSTDKTPEETLDYIKMMIIGDAPEDEMFFTTLPESTMEEIKSYINDPMTATVFSDEDDKKLSGEKSKEFVTSETIYYWMSAQSIPFDCEMWHINRLIALIKLCAIKNQPEDKKKKKMTSSDLALRRAKMEAARAKFAAKK